MAEKKSYDSTLARMAGNIAAGMVPTYDRSGFIGYDAAKQIAFNALTVARSILDRLEADAAPPVGRAPRQDEE